MKKTYFLAAVAILFWSTSATVSKLLLGTLDSMQVLFVSAMFAGLVLMGWNLVSGNIKKLRTYGVRDYVCTILIGLPGTFFYYLLLYTATDLMQASQALTINYLWPIMSVVFACVLLKEKITVRKSAAIGVSFVGMAIVVGADGSNISGDMLFGAVCCVLAAASYGLFTALNQKFGYDKRISMMFFYLTTFVLSGVILGCSRELPNLNWLQTLGMGYNGICNMAIAATAWAVALESGKTVKISNLAYITPFLSLVWTAVFLKEQVRLASVLGLTVIVLGIFIQLKDKET